MKNKKKHGVTISRDIFNSLMVELYCFQQDCMGKAKEELRKGMKYTPRYWMYRRKNIFLLRARLGNESGWYTAREDVR